MKIEVGKKYFTHCGEQVEIVGKLAPERVLWKEYPYVGFLRDAQGMIRAMPYYSEEGVVDDHVAKGMWNLKPNTQKYERYYGFFMRMSRGAPEAVFANATSPDAWERLKLQYTVNYVLLKEGYDSVEIEV